MTYVETRPPDPFAVASGQQTMRREDCSSVALAYSTGDVRLTMLRPRYNFTATQIIMRTGSTAAAATPSICRYGLYLLNAAGDTWTLVGSTPNDTTLFAAANTQYSKTMSASVAMNPASRYAITAMCVTATTAPSFTGVSTQADVLNIAPAMSGTLLAQTDLPSSILVASLGTTSQLFFGIVAP
ncbi:MAG TPA: hypothetical protein VLT90_13175 [Terriglobales bacterium]|nr:hypothetical protein [Terriglobales bacterium]